MVYEAEERPNSYMERFSPNILKRYKYMLETALDRLTLQGMKKRPEENYREYAVRWKNVASMVRPPLTNREENSIFVNILPFSYYDMLVVNVFVEFRDLMLIVFTRANIIEKNRIISDEHVQVMFRERGSKRKSHMTRNEPVKIIFHSLLYA